MGNHHDSIALDWVRGEIQDTLTQGQHALEAYVDNRDDTARLRFCLNYLHQVHGTLQMVELYGAALLTEEMEKLTQAILNETVVNVDDAIEVLMQAILQLPQYLEHLGSSNDDFPMVLLPLLNDLRAARGESLLSDTSLFKPNLNAARFNVTGKVSERLQGPKVLGHLRKLRQMYQFALAGVVREEDLDAHFGYMQKVIDRLSRLCQNTARGELWKAAGAFVETLEARVNPVNTAVKSLLRELDGEIRKLTDEHADILLQPVPEALLKNLLYYVALARHLDRPQVNYLRSAYQLTDALPSDDDVSEARTRVSGPGRDAIQSVVSALNEELGRLKDQLDLFVRAEHRQNNELDELLPGLRQVGNTLAVLGLGIPRKVVTEQIELIGKLCGQLETIDDGTLMDIAGALLYVEASLAGLDVDRHTEVSDNADSGEPTNIGSRELSEANEALIRESRNTLEQAKSAIVNFIASQWDTKEIEHVPALLHSIRGGLGLVPLEHVPDMLDSAERYISDVLLSSQQVPDWRQLDTLADAITSIEYYLERVSEGITDNSTILRIANESLASLGFPVGEEPTWNETGQDEAAETEDVPVLGQPAQEEPGSSQKSSDSELLDDEILSIFVEEAEEVLATIQEYYPRLRRDHGDRDALTEVRRAYHTLKGSGRLVGAESLAEMAWSVENLLNRVIDQTLKATDDMFVLLDDVNARIPELIQDFRQGETAGDVDALISRAEALATTRRTDTPTLETPSPADATERPVETPDVTPVAATPAEPAVTEVNASPEPAADDAEDLIDDEILEIFIEEAGEVLETINEYLPMLLRQYDDRSALAEVRRAFHTLKGSGRMVGAEVIGELSWSVENVLNRIIEGSIFMNDDLAQLLQDVTDVIPTLVRDFEKRIEASVDTAPLEARAQALASGEFPDTSAMPAAEAPESTPEPSPETSASDDSDQQSPDDADQVLLDIFEQEAQTHLETLQNYLLTAHQHPAAVYTDDLSRALHTLRGSANTAGIAPIAAIITPLERFIKEARAQNKRADHEVLELISRASDFLTQGLAQIHDDPQAELDGTVDYLDKLEKVSTSTFQGQAFDADVAPANQVSSQLIQLFLGEGLDIVLDAETILEEWASDPQQTGALSTLRSELESLTDSAADAGLADVANLADALTRLYGAVTVYGLPASASFFETARKAQEQLINQMDQVAAGLATDPCDEIILELHALTDAVNRNDEPDEFEQQFTEDLEEIDLSLEDNELTAPDTADEQHTALPEASDDADMDAELAAIFLEEARDLIDSTAEALQNWSEDTGNIDLLRLLQRDLHTLKGGARLADIEAVGDLAHELENLFEGLTEKQLSINSTLSDLLFRCHDRLAGMVDALEAQNQPKPAPDLVHEIQQYMGEAQGVRSVTDVVPETGPQTETGHDHTETPESADVVANDDTASGVADLSHLDPELLGIFLEEAYDLINSTGSALHNWSENPSDRSIAAELQRDVHTLKGGARMAGVDAIGDLTHVLEDLFEKVAEGHLDASGSMIDRLFACHDRLAQMVEQVATQQPCPPAQELEAQVRAILRGDEASDVDAASDREALPEQAASDREHEELVSAFDAESADESQAEDILGIFLDEGLEIHDAIAENLELWREQPNELTALMSMRQELHTLKGGARLSDLDAIADLADAWSELLDDALAGNKPAEAALALSDRAQANLRTMLNAMEAGKQPELDFSLIDALGQSGTEMPAPEAEVEQQEAPDPEVLEIFLEEANEIMDQLEQLLADWHKEPNNHHFNQEAQRAMHTLKGGARLSQLSGLGDKAHTFETLLIDLGGNAPSEAQWQEIGRQHDDIIAAVAEIRARFEQGEALPQVEAEAAPAEPEQSSSAAIPAPLAAEVTPEPPEAKPVVRKPSKHRSQKAAEAQRAAQETIRVSAPLLDDLVNLAGETSITRGRLEQQSSDFSHTLDEMAATIERLREQLRRMEIETETQILFRAEQEHGADYGEDFDPLEMDRYSSIQQLSRALTESTSDLADLRETLADRVRDTETLLVQQSRINTELQEGLMKTRMVPFASTVPRLRRIVRQISGELGKKVDFDVRNAEGEMDRSILERMIAPLEHMLRNALDHGIETPQERRQAGKPETGEVVLSLTREGGDVVLRMIDDGKGIPADVIRDKAIRQGLMHENEALSEREILQFILQPGFSTAEQVTQISGRGVGMDVVASEIKQLGGSLDIDSSLGRGTTFTVRLPFTVSVNRALMVATGEDFYAIPLNTIEGIVRVSTYELEEYYKPDAPLYEYAGQQYRLQYLGNLLNSDHHPKLQGQALPLPVILVRGAEQPLALQVDHLMGSREIVVKSLGPQFSTVRGVSGATILGDGNVVVILDLPAMIRSDVLSDRQRIANLAKERTSGRFEEQVTTVMVVDDSVTVRKVTSRLLERNGMEVITAKDGLDAVAQLQDHRPDVILLDIEMPRMDGFEVASFVRHDDTLKETPICMITSRTGEKHRERALAIGVNEYLGKPFQETVLLETIKRLTESE
ncbi:Hpt domain-containing protein [Marinobacter litoralis]|uniref:hybrid sensor histidine kinase/response regulator n=1 Tax=Marinobacter litoralis TaxID=187981 RepID=UPI0018EC7278|nr:Hpt domain-containing protein [Marinobacter litoralis]MBJ6136463.1 Hpt domain-containing protein [Marinobacter litoralis]